MGSKNVELEEEKEKSAVLMIERTSLSTTVYNRAAVAEGEGEASHKIGGWTRVKEKRTKEEEDAGGTHSIHYSKSDTKT